MQPRGDLVCVARIALAGANPTYISIRPACHSLTNRRVSLAPPHCARKHNAIAFIHSTECPRQKFAQDSHKSHLAECESFNKLPDYERFSGCGGRALKRNVTPSEKLIDCFVCFRDCRVVRDPQTLKSKGYGFVSFIKKAVSFFLSECYLRTDPTAKSHISTFSASSRH